MKSPRYIKVTIYWNYRSKRGFVRWKWMDRRSDVALVTLFIAAFDCDCVLSVIITTRSVDLCGLSYMSTDIKYLFKYLLMSLVLLWKTNRICVYQRLSTHCLFLSLMTYIYEILDQFITFGNYKVEHRYLSDKVFAFNIWKWIGVIYRPKDILQILF